MSMSVEASPPRVTSHRGLAIGAALVSIAAWCGATGLVFGFNSLPATLEQRLPLHSPVLGGVALSLIVAVPYSLLALWAWRRDPRQRVASIACGVTLVSWIVVELAIIRELSFLHPLCVAIGVAFIWCGRRLDKEGARPHRSLRTRTGS